MDVFYFYFNIFIFGIVFGWALLSYEVLSHAVAGGLTALFGARPPSALPVLVSRSIITVMLFLAYELGYWLNHYLSHRVPFLWEFHKVHHTATVLTPLTNFRVHPVYMCIFLNILALFTGLANGVGDYLLGQTTHQYGLSENNIILVFFIYLYVHLQHTQLWISFTGWLGHLLMSPAHHQIHHSRDPAHFNKNLGSCLAVWDWMFGTLYIPAAERERLDFGVEPDRQRRAHDLGRADRAVRPRRSPGQATVRRRNAAVHFACRPRSEGGVLGVWQRAMARRFAHMPIVDAANLWHQSAPVRAHGRHAVIPAVGTEQTSNAGVGRDAMLSGIRCKSPARSQTRQTLRRRCINSCPCSSW